MNDSQMPPDLPPQDAATLLRHAVDGDPALAAREVSIAAGLEHRERCLGQIAGREAAMELLGGADWRSIVERGASGDAAPGLWQDNPELAGLAARVAGEASSRLDAARSDARARRRESGDAAARRESFLSDPGYLPQGALRRRALWRRALAAAVWACEGCAAMAAALAGTDGFRDYASLSDVPWGTVVSSGGYGLGVALGYFALKILLVRAVRGWLARRSAALAGLALFAGTAAAAYAAALAGLRAGGWDPGLALDGAGSATFALLFIGMPALAVWAERLAADAGAIEARADAALAEEEGLSAALAAAEREAEAAEAAEARCALAAGLADSLPAWFEADVSGYRAATRAAGAAIERRVLAFLSVLAAVRAMGRPERVRWAEAERRRLRRGEE